MFLVCLLAFLTTLPDWVFTPKFARAKFAEHVDPVQSGLSLKSS